VLTRCVRWIGKDEIKQGAVWRQAAGTPEKLLHGAAPDVRASLELEGLKIGLNAPAGLGIAFDERRPCGTAAERLQPDNPAAGIQIEPGAVKQSGTENVEERRTETGRGGTGRRALGRTQDPSFLVAGADPQGHVKAGASGVILDGLDDEGETSLLSGFICMEWHAGADMDSSPYHIQTVWRGMVRVMRCRPTVVGRHGAAAFDSAWSLQYNPRSVIEMQGVACFGWRRVRGVLCGVCCGVILFGCGGARTILRPSSGTAPTVEVGAGVRVTVGPVTASSELQPDEISLLARFFSVLWIDVRNGSSAAVMIDPEEALLFDQTGTPWLALDSEQRGQVLRWQAWSWRSWLAKWLWAGRVESLTKKLNRLQLEAGALSAGEERRGLLVFKLVPPPVCRQATLEWRLSQADQTPGESMVRMAVEC
jgi:hypothetical protein